MHQDLTESLILTCFQFSQVLLVELHEIYKMSRKNLLILIYSGMLMIHATNREGCSMKVKLTCSQFQGHVLTPMLQKHDNYVRNHCDDFLPNWAVLAFPMLAELHSFASLVNL